ncbi:winged helix-turn-helix transcriptional regulator [Paenibacillus contaminans]|uniref:HTH hxlR-type domain-containing protein n=1 Tax=Paenibacillus contaminans TaxID=450362 RepID=A0A329M8W5_9BACL|nr:winged helix-turn-helix transcriptional regulator [Paenibacillus contaminans]RAV16132.1 hypothetical protein DQG23_29380 [Paenibacillus contaminans]
MRQRQLFVRLALLFLTENPCSDELVRQTKLIVAFASLTRQNEHFTGEIVRIASLTIRFSPLRVRSIHNINDIRVCFRNRSSSIPSFRLDHALVRAEVEQYGIVKREVFPTVPVSVEYSLTESGREFGSILLQMKHWGDKWMTEPLRHAGDSHSR